MGGTGEEPYPGFTAGNSARAGSSSGGDIEGDRSEPLGVLPAEQSEERGTISVNGLDRVAQAMGCKLIYAVVPRNGKTLEDMAEKGLRTSGQRSEIRVQKDGESAD